MINTTYESKPFKLAIIIVVLYILCYAFRDTTDFVLSCINNMLPSHIETIQVIFPLGEHEKEYVIFASNGDKYVNQDSWIKGKHNSGVIQGYLLGKKHVAMHGKPFSCSAEVAGVRLSLPSMFPNIIKIDCD